MQYIVAGQRQNLLIPAPSHSTKSSLDHQPGIGGQHLPGSSGTSDLHSRLRVNLTGLRGNTKACRERKPDANQTPPGPRPRGLTSPTRAPRPHDIPWTPFAQAKPYNYTAVLKVNIRYTQDTAIATSEPPRQAARQGHPNTCAPRATSTPHPNTHSTLNA